MLPNVKKKRDRRIYRPVCRLFTAQRRPDNRCLAAVRSPVSFYGYFLVIFHYEDTLVLSLTVPAIPADPVRSSHQNTMLMLEYFASDIMPEVISR